MHQALKGAVRYPAEFVLGMAVMGALWLLLGAVLVTAWPLGHPAAAKPSGGGRASLPEVVTWRAATEAPALIEVSSAEMSPPTLAPLETSASAPVIALAEPAAVRPGPPAAQFPVSEAAGPASPLVGWPVAGEVSNPFGCTVYYSGIPGPSCPATAPWFHDGLDIAAPAGRPVRAALTGTVLFAGPDGSGPDCGDYRGYGQGVVVDTGNGWQALYAHLSRIEVSAGQVITPDTLIGAVGETGCVSGPHLHFGLRYGPDLVDPQSVRQE
ncbi:MAG: M23 family metallopeptidase [Anaerolineae bacterium]|nr:M23 family metallopeptidase [Anaerolineae bacterium]